MGDMKSIQNHTIHNRIGRLPRKMLFLKDQENIAEFVLHELCHPECFNFDKVAYLIDNPDFDCLRGVSGFCRAEAYLDDDIWSNPRSFSAHMQGASFNKLVRSLSHKSMRKNHASDDAIIDAIAQELKLHNPDYYVWDMKHDNHGLFIYERSQPNGVSHHTEDVLDGLSLLGFCPIY